jgi:putative restriction endonuclease
MEPSQADPDADIRIAAFARLRSLLHAAGGALPWSEISQGFTARDRRYLFATAAEGIFRPVGMTSVLSIKTVVPKPKGRIWYHDQSSPDLSPGSDVFWYAFTGKDPGSTRNRWLHDAMAQQLPLIYFFGVAPALYEPLFPAFVVEWNPTRLSCGLSFQPSFAVGERMSAPTPAERRYALRTVQQRLHQALFRAKVIDAYGMRCALSGLPEPRLIDAAHIVPDAHEQLGQPDIRNGICMSKVHHAAYDAGLIGIDPDLKIHVSDSLLALHDGPMLEQALKALSGKTLRVPDDPLAAPDRDRLALRFKQYRMAAA